MRKITSFGDDFDAIKFLLASPQDILSWSHGEVKKAETINYRTMRAEVDGLMCEKIFGPTKNYQCFCGKYRKMRYKGIVCDKCGVEVTTSRVRRERMGHVKLVVPVAHVWFVHNVPSKISLVLGISSANLVNVVYYNKHIIIKTDEDLRKTELQGLKDYLEDKLEDLKKQKEQKEQELHSLESKELSEVDTSDKEKLIIQQGIIKEKYVKKRGEISRWYEGEVKELQQEINYISALVSKLQRLDIISDEDLMYLEEYGITFAEVSTGAEAIEKLLKEIDLQGLKKKLESDLIHSPGNTPPDIIKRLKYVTGMVKNGINPEWMILHVLPVIPPDLRPIISLPGGRFAVSDLNDLYRRVINRNNRLKKLIDIGAPEIILRNEKRMLQEAVDALIDNSHNPHRPVMNSKRLPYKSLADGLRGKKGRFRQNLLGKRVDFSGRAVIEVGPNLKLHECGIPSVMAVELFRPFVISKLLEKKLAISIYEAKQIIDNRESVIWDVLEEILKERPVLLNRPPTLHKQNLQGYYGKLVDGYAIRLHPLVCAGYNADFDGDQMGIFVPLSTKAIKEIEKYMFPRSNIIRLANGEPIISFSKDMVWGLYYLTDIDETHDIKLFSSPDVAIGAYYDGMLKLHIPIKTFVNGKSIVTTVGRLIFNEALPDSYPYVNEQVNKSTVARIVKEVLDLVGNDELVIVLDKIKDLAFRFATVSGFSFSKVDLKSYRDEAGIVKEATQKESEIIADYNEGLITEKERDRLIQQLWLDATERLEDAAWKKLQKDTTNSVYLQIKTKSSGSIDNLKQIVAIKGLVKDPSAAWVPLPIKSNYTEGLSVFEFFIAAKGGRKGLADTALRTADSGYLTRRLVDVAHNAIVREEDCGYEGEGIAIHRSDVRNIDFNYRIVGRVVTKDVKTNNKVVVKKGEIITKDAADKIVESNVDTIWVRSALLCKSPVGICAKCYGAEIGNDKLIELGGAVGVIAAQSVGEASTQMTLRTFHFGGSKKTDIVQGIPRLVELFEVREPSKPAIISGVDGVVAVVDHKDYKVITTKGKTQINRHFFIKDVLEVKVSDGQSVKKEDDLFIIDKKSKVIAPFNGIVEIVGNVLFLKGQIVNVETFRVPNDVDLLVKDGENVKMGQQLTSGNVSPRRLYEVLGYIPALTHIVNEIQAVYVDQGIEVEDKHLEVLIRQMARGARILDGGDTNYLPGEIVDRYLLAFKNRLIKEVGGKPAAYIPILMSVRMAALNSDSPLSALSFQEEVRGLTEISLTGKIDYLRGLKENVIVGRLVPVGELGVIEDMSTLTEVQLDLSNISDKSKLDKSQET